jgi:hypothetical protein
MKRVVLSERQEAAFGPRSLKKLGSPEWCWQTLNGMVADYKLIDERFKEVDQALQELKTAEAWKVIPTDKPYGSLTRMLVAELGIDPHKIQREIKDAQTRQVGKHSGAPLGNKNASKNNDYNITIDPKPKGTSRAFILGCLDRDGHADLAKQVRAGDVSARKAGQSVGYKFLAQPTPFEQIMKLLPKLSKSERRKLQQALKED